MKIALAQINTTIGDFTGNVKKIVSFATEARQHGADLCLFPEQCIAGYPAHDLLERSRFIDQNLAALEQVKRGIKDLAVVVGFAERNPGQIGKGLYNSAALIVAGEVVSIHRKSLLPTYDVFDETRYFDRAPETNIVEFNGFKLGLTICEDVWNDPDFWTHRFYDFDPPQHLIDQGAEIILNIAASPFTIHKRHLRQEMLKALARHHQKPLLFVNSVGGNDDLVFDGASLGINPNGEIVQIAKEFSEDLIYFDFKKQILNNKQHQILIPPQDSITKSTTCDRDAAIEALIIGTRDYAHKCGFKTGLVGLSGGIDSALVAYLGTEAFGAANMQALLMPSPYSSSGSVTDAEQLAQNLGIAYQIIPIESILESYLKILTKVLNADDLGVTEENLQARIRGNLLMAFSNRNGNLLLTTGNKSELAIGYCTLYGDMAGGLAVISDVPKTMVYELSNHLNRDREIIPQAILDKPPSAELKPGQLDSDSLPPYDLLDEILENHILHGLDYPKLVELGFNADLVENILQLVRKNEYKRRQAPPGIKLTTKAFGVGRRVPLAQRWIP